MTRIFECQKDLTFLGKTLLSKGSKIEIENEYILSPENGPTIKLTLSDILSDSNFVEITSPLNMTINLVEANEEDQVRDWVLQLKLTISRKKLREVESFLNTELPKFLED